MAPIRLALEADRLAVEAVVHAAYRPWIARIGREPAPMGDDYAARIMERTVYVVGAPLIGGIVVLIVEGDVMLLDNIAVRPEAQGLGLGRALLAFAEAQASRAGCRAIRLYTNQAMVENIALYERRGYVETGRGTVEGRRRVDMRKAIEA